MNKISDLNPDYCLTFSPNWYLPQIASFDKWSHLLAYGVNNSVFLMNYSLKVPITIINCEINVNNDLNPSLKKLKQIDDKITSVLLHQNYLIVGFENSFLSIWRIDKNFKENNQISIKQYDFCKQILFILPVKQDLNEKKEEKIICVDSQGISLIITFNEKGIINEELRKNSFFSKPDNNNKIKLISFKLIFGDYFIFVFNSGIMQIWPINFELLIHEINIKKKILYIDSIISLENNIETIKILCVTKEHSKNTVLLTSFSKDDLAFILKDKKNKKKNELIIENKEENLEKITLASIHSEIKLDFHLTETYIHNKEDLKLASVCIKWLNPQEFLISGKLGEIYLMKKNLFENKTKIKFSPLSHENDVNDNSYYTVPDNPHFKSIYEIYYIDSEKQNELDLLLTFGLDRKIVFWNLLKTDVQNSFKFDWKINCLGGKVKCITSSLKEKNLVIFGCYDHTVKLWNLAKKNNKFFTIEIWRKLNSYDLNDIKVSFQDPEILYIHGNSNLLLIYNAYSQQLINSFQSSLIIVSFYEILTEFLEYFRDNFSKIESLENFKIEIKNFVSTKTNNNKNGPQTKFLLMLCKNCEASQSQIPNFYFIVYGFCHESTEIFKLNLQNITSMNMKVFDLGEFPQFIMGFGNYYGSINLFHAYKNHDMINYASISKEIEKIHSYKINCIDFSLASNNNYILLATGSNDRKIIVSSIEINYQLDKENIIKICTIYKFVHKVQIMSLSWALDSQKLVCVGINHHTVQVWDFSQYTFEKIEENKSSQEYELCNIRGHSGYIVAANFYAENSNFVVTASDDQTIKVWDTSLISNKKPPNKKKNNKKNKNK